MKNRFSARILWRGSQQEARKRPARGQQEARKRPQMGGTPRNTETIEKQVFFMERIHQFCELFEKPIFWRYALAGKPARSQEEARKRPGRGPKWGGPHETPKPLKNKHFHEENFTSFGSSLKNRFSREILVGKLEASKKPRGRQEARKRTARGQQEASKRPARRQQEARKRSQMGGTPRNTETIEN